MTTQTASANLWHPRNDRGIYAVWLAIIWIGIIVGFGLDLPSFLRLKPPAPWIVHPHAVVFTGWLVLLSVQIWLVENGRIGVHRRIGIAGAVLAGVMMVLGPVTALTVEAQALSLSPRDFDGRFLAINFLDIADFGILIAAGLLWRNSPAIHKRLMLLATVALSDPGFGRITDNLFHAPKQFVPLFFYAFYGNVLVIAAMGAWDLWRRGRLHPAFVAGASLLLASEITMIFLMSNAVWKDISYRIVSAWGYAG